VEKKDIAAVINEPLIGFTTRSVVTSFIPEYICEQETLILPFDRGSWVKSVMY
jgi:hypothetical protein